MEFRRQLITTQVALVAVIAVTAFMTVAVLRSATTRTTDAYQHLASDLKLSSHVHWSAHLVATAARRCLSEGTDVQRSRLTRLQRELDPSLDRLAARAIALRAPHSERFERVVDSYIAWLAAVATERVAPADFERTLEGRSRDLEQHIAWFGNAARSHGAEAIAKANRLAGRAQLGVLLTSGIGIGIGLALGMMALRRIGIQTRRA